MSISFPASAKTVDSIVFNPLRLPGINVSTMAYIIIGGQQLPTGAVLGRITASGKLTLCVAAAGDGSQVPHSITPHPINTFAADNVTPLDAYAAVYVKGYFNETALYLGTGLVLANVKEQLKDIGILLRAPGYSG